MKYHGCWWPGDARRQDISSRVTCSVKKNNCTNYGFLSLGPLETILSEIWIKVEYFSWSRMHMQMVSFLCGPQWFNPQLISPESYCHRGLGYLWNTRTIYPANEIPRLLMTWRRMSPGHQQPWYWPSYPRIKKEFRNQCVLVPCITRSPEATLLTKLSQNERMIVILFRPQWVNPWLFPLSVISMAVWGSQSSCQIFILLSMDMSSQPGGIRLWRQIEKRGTRNPTHV